MELARDMAHITHAVVTVNKTCVSCGLVIVIRILITPRRTDGSPAIIALQLHNTAPTATTTTTTTTLLFGFNSGLSEAVRSI